MTPHAALSGGTNPQEFVNGREAETPEEHLQRFQKHLNELARGTSASLEEGAKNTKLLDGNGFITEQITKALAVDVSNSNVALYVHNGSTTAQVSNALKTEVEKIVVGFTDSQGIKHAGYKPAGVPCTVYKATLSVQNVGLTLTLKENFSLAMVRTSVERAVASFFASLPIGDGTTIVYQKSALIAAVLRVAGVHAVTVTSPGTDTITPTLGTILVPGTTTLVAA